MLILLCTVVYSIHTLLKYTMQSRPHIGLMIVIQKMIFHTSKNGPIDCLKNDALLLFFLIQQPIILLNLSQQHMEHLRNILSSLRRALKEGYTPTIRKTLRLLGGNLSFVGQIFHTTN